MGSVRGVLPRLAVFGLAVAAFVILLTVSRAGAAVAAPEPDPVGALDGAIAAALPTDPGELPLPLVLDGSEAAPSVENPEQMLSTDLAPELAPTAILLATPAPANQPGAIDAGPAPPSPLIEASDSPPAGPVLPGLTDGAAAPLADEVTRAAIAIPPVSTLPFDQDLVGELDVPSVLLSLSHHASPPTPLPDPQPADPEGAFLRPATAPTIVANPSARHATAPVGESTSSFGPPAGTFATGGEPMPPDPGAGSGPARAPPNDAPSDPPHRGSTDHASHEYSALPGTDRIGDTRGESWHPGTDVEMSNTPPEPSVSPD